MDLGERGVTRGWPLYPVGRASGSGTSRQDCCAECLVTLPPGLGQSLENAEVAVKTGPHRRRRGLVSLPFRLHRLPVLSHHVDIFLSPVSAHVVWGFVVDSFPGKGTALCMPISPRYEYAPLSVASETLAEHVFQTMRSLPNALNPPLTRASVAARVSFNLLLLMGKVSGHVHTITAGSNFRVSINTSFLRQSAYTSSPIKEDKSNSAEERILYEGQRNPVMQVAPLFRMLSASMTLRNYNGSNYAHQAVTILCLDLDDTSITGSPELDLDSASLYSRCILVRPSWDTHYKATSGSDFAIEYNLQLPPCRTA
ncbi:hypothetical protein FB451DRAFT_1368062 [Mycena latifolia]|nr:hypothetical protein FB451DRAFT_1368062 [Mycena latifolia]